MGRPAQQAELFSGAPDDGRVVALNARCLLRTQDGHRVVVVGGMPVSHFAVEDRAAEAHAMVSIVEAGWAEQRQVAAAFGYSTRTVRRCERRLEEGGLAALGRPSGYPAGRPRSTERSRKAVAALRAAGVPIREIARRRGVTEKAIRKQLRRLGWRPPTVEQQELALGADPNLSAAPSAAPQPAGEPPAPADPNLSAAPSAVPQPAAEPRAPADPNLSAAPSAAPQPAGEPPAPADPNVSAPVEDLLPETLDTNPADRRADRLLAHLGMLRDAAPLFGDAERVPNAGVLLALPSLLDTGVLQIGREVYGSLAPAFYGLRTTIVTFLLMALLRIRRPEAIKEHSPSELGRILGLDRAPEVKTLRRKLARMAAMGRACEFGRRLAQRRVEQHPDTLGFLYFDGHVRVYTGRRDIPMAHVARMRIAAPATSDYWVNDSRGDPLLVVTAQANAGMVKMLPLLLDEIRRLAGDRRVTIVFDRGGWSPRLFKTILDGNFDIITYRKGAAKAISRRNFIEQTQTLDGKERRYTLAETELTLLDGALHLRQVTRLSDDKKHQTHIVTSRRDLSAVEVAYRMFERWRQENFFKYLREEYALDALVDYGVEPDDPTRTVPNPKRIAVDVELRAARSRLEALKQKIGGNATVAALGIGGQRRRPAIDPTIARALGDAVADVISIEQRRTKVPRRIPVAKRTDGAVIKLATERKHLSNVLKLVAYQAESDLVRRLAAHYRRHADEGRTLVQNALATPADIRVADGELWITLRPLSSPHRTAAIAALCRELDQRRLRFPGSRLTLRYAVATG